MPSNQSAIFSLYRAFHRQIRVLPTEYLRQFFKIKLGDDVRALLQTSDRKLQSRKTKRVRKELQKMTLANQGNTEKFDHVLDLAYGRKGKLRWELMNYFLKDPGAPQPDAIIPAVPSSRPPVYSPELAALLTSPRAHKSSHLTPQALETPPTMPARADPYSEDARLLGPLSKRRQVNIRWRFFSNQKKRIYPPLQVNILEKTASGELQPRTDVDAVNRAGIRELGMQDIGVYEEVLALARPLTERDPVACRVRESLLEGSKSSLSPRFLQRRFAHLLGRLPLLTYSPPRSEGNEAVRPDPREGKYSVSLAPLARHADLKNSPARMEDADAIDIAWFESAQQADRLRQEAAKQQKRPRAER
ncbi:hypothetical protein WOLCODRAFT_112802 [Wolfiporia cocos MD-104 SS10]|uniref:LYR motif-containing protein Cup1-like N-terminal domain-containing protein n=1 Tax=Wolfiporia cocos (strain MD-104) TaxID=742152 RepID=A0A2H3IV98_WOLCO|nr:hypothetical protein WOLCODRAFT_112802 [Wolfiporia cocos MD-104 SS10]